METKSPIKIAHLSSVHPPTDIRIFHKECRSLQDAGYDTVLVIPHERSEQVAGVRIHAVSRPQSRRQRILHTTRMVLRAALDEKAAVYHFHDPELIPIGWILKLRGKRVIYDVHEDLPRQTYYKEWIPKNLRLFVSLSSEVMETVAARIFDGIVAATPAIAKRFPKNKTVTVQNFPWLHLPGGRKTPYAKRAPLFAYAGVASPHRGIREMISAVHQVKPRYKARLAFAGNLSPENLLQKLQKTPGWKKVDFLGWQPQAEVAKTLSRARAGLVLFHPGPNHSESQPNKMFEYMAAGLPLIASDFPLWRKIIETARCGLVVDPMKPAAIARAMEWMLDHPKEAEEMGKNGRKAVREIYNWDAEKEQLLDLYRRLLK